MGLGNDMTVAEALAPAPAGTGKTDIDTKADAMETALDDAVTSGNLTAAEVKDAKVAFIDWLEEYVTPHLTADP